MSCEKKVLLIGTYDTKHQELGYVFDLLQGKLAGSRKLLVHTLDVSFGAPRPEQYPYITFPNTLLIPEDGRATQASRDERRALITKGLAELVLSLFRTNDYAVVCGLGGSNGTSLFNLAVRDLPLMYPRKICLSTVAHDQNADQLDITFIPSVCDLAGLNPLSRLALESLAGTVIGQAAFAKPLSQQLKQNNRQLVAIYMFGNTTAGVISAAELLEQHGFDSVIYHAVGSGGRALIKGVQEGIFSGVLDITTTERLMNSAAACYQPDPID